MKQKIVYPTHFFFLELQTFFSSKCNEEWRLPNYHFTCKLSPAHYIVLWPHNICVDNHVTFIPLSIKLTVHWCPGWDFYYYFQLRTAAFKAYCAIWVRRSNFHHQAPPRVSPRDSTQRRKVELWARNVREFCLNADLHVTFIWIVQWCTDLQTLNKIIVYICKFYVFLS